MGMQPPDFRHYLTYNNVRREIFFLPKSWEKNSSVSHKRDAVYFGMIRTWGLPLEFVEDGARILRAAYYQDGIEAGVIIEVEQLVNSNWGYELSFKGDIDFSEVHDEKNTFTVKLSESGTTARIKAYENVKYEYQLSGSDVVNMMLPGVAFKEESKSIFIPLPTDEGHKRFIPETTIATLPFQSGFITNQSVTYQNVNDSGFSSSGNWFVTANRVQKIRIEGNMSGTAFGTLGRNGFSIRLMNQANLTMRVLYEDNTENGLINFDFAFDFEYTLAINEKLFIYCRMRDTDGVGIKINGGDLNVSYSSVSDPSPCKGIKASDMFKRIVGKVAPGAQTASYLLANTWTNLIFTSGNAIREIEKAKIKISLKEFFQTMQSLDDSAMGIDAGAIRLETKNYFARDSQSVNVGVIADDDCVISPAKTYLASRIKVGYEDKNTEDKDGLDEYNSGQEWEMPLSRVQNELNWISAARADQYGIEKVRVNYNVLKIDNIQSGKDTADTPSDNDTFLIDCYLDGELYRPILGTAYESVTGLNSPDTSYNLRITPKKNLLRHGAYLRSIMDRMDANYINFASAQKNAELKTVKDSVGVKENENILVASLPDRYFKPHIAEISCKLPFGAKNLFDAMPFGYMTFIWKGVTLKGYIMEGSVDIARNTTQDFTLLLTHDNNLLNLIQ